MLTIAIPTLNRGEIVVNTVESLLALRPAPSAIIVADQTPRHPDPVERRLREWNGAATIAWLRLAEPSIPAAMNEALRRATTEIVLFLDDDVVPAPELLHAHLEAHRDPSIWAVAGQVLQPGEAPADHPPAANDLEFRFNGTAACLVTNVMAGNLSVKRAEALRLGGFDENFIGAAYRFETDFAARLCRAGGKILFQPRASLRHLKLGTGGLRTYGDHMTAASPLHSVGDYYYAAWHVPRFWEYALRRLCRNVLTRYHARHPWTIPAKLIGEFRGLLLARRLYRRGRRLLGRACPPGSEPPAPVL